MLDFTKARRNMVKQQIEPWQVSDPKILTLMNDIPRERYVPAAYQDLAYADAEIPLPHAQVMLAPKVVGRALQALQIQPDETVLQLGTGMGYITALLSRLAQRVYAIEKHADLLDKTDTILNKSGCFNVHCHLSTGATGWETHGPYDVIMVTGAFYQLPQALKAQLKPKGRLFAFCGQAPAMQALLFDARTQETTVLFETVVPYMEDINLPQDFVF